MEAVMVSTKKRQWQTYCQFSDEFASICRAAVIAAMIQQYLQEK
jgi:hypothetical protein